MKAGIVIFMFSLAVWACAPVKENISTSAAIAQESKDSTEYELIITDPRFDEWYEFNYTPAKDYSNEYYRSKNEIAVMNWNHYYTTGQYINIIEEYINYEPRIDYGIEVNRKLYWYFKYMRNEYKIRLFF